MNDGTDGRGCTCRTGVGTVADIGLALLRHDDPVSTGVRVGGPAAALDIRRGGPGRVSIGGCGGGPREGRRTGGLRSGAATTADGVGFDGAASSLVSTLLTAVSMISRTSWTKH